MRRHHPFRWLLALILIAGFPARSQAPAVSARSTHSTPSALLPAPAPPADTTPAAHNPAQAKPLADEIPEQLGDSLEVQQRYQAAIAAYSKVPHPSAGTWNKMGIAYQMMFNLRDTTRCYKESLHLDQKNAMVVNNLATVYDSMKQYSAAERLYRKALKIDPDSPLILKNLGTNLLVQHKDSKGWKIYEEAMKLDPTIFESQGGPTVHNPASIKERGAMNYFMARGCVRMGQTECALQYLRMAVSEGYTTVKRVSADADFASLRASPAFKRWIAEEQQLQQHP